MTTTAASTAGSSSPRTSFVADSLILPTRNGSLFASAFALVYVHTFVSLSVAVLYAHPLAAAVLLRVDALVRDKDGYDDVYASESDEEIRGHAKTLLLLYLAYLASQLAARVAVALASIATCAGDRRPCSASLAELVAAGRIRSTLATAALVAVLQLASSASLLAACLASWCWWTRGAAARSDTAAAVASFASGYVMFLLLLVLLSHVFLAAVFQVAIAASAADEAYGEGAALRRAWRLMTARARRKEAAVMVLVASLLPVAIYPVYAFAIYCMHSGACVRNIGVLSLVHGYLLPSAGVQLYSTVAAAVFYHRCMEHHDESAMPLTMKQAS